MGLRIVFAGTAEFAIPTLQAIINSQHELVAVYTQPDRPAGRGQQLRASLVKEVAQSHNIPVLQPLSLKSAETQKILQAFNADIMIVVAYGLMIPKKVLSLFPYGCLNVHPSLLPRWRGAAPIQRAILAGDKITGICIMQMDSGLDTGPILWQHIYPLDPNITSGELHDLLAKQGANALLETLEWCEQGKLQPTAQDNNHATYAAKIDKHEAEIDWRLSTEEIHNQIRGYHPWPIAYTYYRQKILRVWKSEMLSAETTAAPGTLVHCSHLGIDVATANGQLRLLLLQLPGGKPMSAQDFLNGQRSYLHPGETQLGQDHPGSPK